MLSLLWTKYYLQTQPKKNKICTLKMKVLPIITN